MVKDELDLFRQELRECLAQHPHDREALAELFARYHFASGEDGRNNQHGQCSMETQLIAVWPTEVRETMHQVGAWACAEWHNTERRLEWCARHNTLLLRIERYNEFGYHLRDLIERYETTDYRALSVKAAVEYLSTSQSQVEIPGVPYHPGRSN